MAQTPNKPSRTGAAAVAIRRDVWDDWQDASIAWAIKEQVDNCFNKADRGLSNTAVPWNAQNIELRLDSLGGEGMQSREVLVLSDDGRGLTYEEFAEGFYGLGHTSSNRPQDIQENAISVFGTGSKTGDACLAAGVYYFTAHANADYTILARTGKELSLAKNDPDLLIADVCMPNKIRRKLKAEPSYACAWQFTRHLTTTNQAEMGFIMDRLSSLTEARFNAPFDESGDGEGLRRLLTEVDKYLPVGTSGFVRMLMLRPKKVLHVGLEGKGLHYHVDYRAGLTYTMHLCTLLERNYLFPPGPQEGISAEQLAEQQEVVQSLQAPDYYTHPETGQLYSPRITVHGQQVNWGNNPLLTHWHCKRSPVITIEPNTELFGDSKGEPPARIIVQYLGDTMEDRKESEHSGVAVYVGCRRVCDPELLKNNWTMAGVGDELTEFAAGVTDWAVWHSSHAGARKSDAREREVMSTREYMSHDLYDFATHKAQRLQDLWNGKDSHFLTLRGVHLAVVVKPGLLRLNDDKRTFLGNTPHGKNLMYECVWRAVSWMLANPPRDQEKRLEEHREAMARRAEEEAAEKAARLLQKQELAAQALLKKQQLRQRTQEGNQVTAKKRKTSARSDVANAAPGGSPPTRGNTQPDEAQAGTDDQDQDMAHVLANVHGALTHIKDEPVDGNGFASPLVAAATQARSAPALLAASNGAGATSKKPAAAKQPARLAPKTVLTNLVKQIKKSAEVGKAVEAVQQVIDSLAPETKNTRLTIKQGAPAWISSKK